jgi:hypothetical protein
VNGARTWPIGLNVIMEFASLSHTVPGLLLSWSFTADRRRCVSIIKTLEGIG